MPHYIWNNQDITLDILMKIEQVVRILSEKLKKPFDEELRDFYKSRNMNSNEFIPENFFSYNMLFIYSFFIQYIV